ncbi:MAG: ATP synthase F1 subunit delta [Gammaproteobacteria bacterium RIFCSPHIGHO2_12_FULL_38_11]|nr:MAG: ATP synthase F1 subunit delta [Gammaproteobacteria bacterium RIFCSPHIGHO2_12_FULL_38_11]
MTSNVTLSRPYAKAAFSIAKSENKLLLWMDALKKLSLAVNDKKMASVLKNPNISKKQLCELLSVFAPQQSIVNFIQLLVDKKRLNLLPAIFEVFEADCANESGYISLLVSSAFPMDVQQREKITEILSKKLNSAVNIDFNVDEKLMGGLLIRSGNWVLDDTIKGKLARLKSALT